MVQSPRAGWSLFGAKKIPVGEKIYQSSSPKRKKKIYQINSANTENESFRLQILLRRARSPPLIHDIRQEKEHLETDNNNKTRPKFGSARG